MTSLLKSVPLFFCLLAAFPVQATHIRSADLIVSSDCQDPFLFTITVRAYLNTTSTTRFGTNSQIYFGDGSAPFQIPLTESVLRPELGERIAVAEYTTTHRFPRIGSYTIAYVERDRSRGILNIFDSEDTPYVTFVQVTVTERTFCNRLPVLSVPPLDRACHKVAFQHNPGAFDPDGDSLSYILSTPASSPTSPAVYTSPVDPKFYSSFGTGNEDQNGPPTFGIDAITGDLTWDAPGLQGEYNVAFKILEWRKDNITDTWFLISATTRDMQIVVVDCQNNRPSITVPGDVCVVAGTVLSQSVLGADPDDHVVKVELFSETLQLPVAQSPASYSPLMTSFAPSDPPVRIDYIWSTVMGHVRNQSYQVVAKITDDPEDGPKLTAFGSWQIKVSAPAPQWSSIVYDVVENRSLLSWEAYPAGASKIQIWRKVGSYAFPRNNCTPGIPKNSGYALVGETDPTATSYIDSNKGLSLSPGAVYCYRIVAYFNAPAAVASLASDEVCVGPVRADAPVITHVTVDRTDSLDGAMRVSWRSPFNIDKTQFPPPYEVEVQRAEGLFGDQPFAYAGRVRDTTFLDTGIDTRRQAFHYRLVLYSKPAYRPDFIPVDTSAVASSVWLTAIPGEGKIDLVWRDSVPWSNVVAERPWHRIYRMEGNPDDAKLQLIDSVDVGMNGFVYTDSRVRPDGWYSYVVQTLGTYGNPAIALQNNRSQRVSAYPVSDLVPCVPRLAVDRTDCEEWLRTEPCTSTTFRNRVVWSVSAGSACRRDVVAYRVYRRSAYGEFSFLARVSDTVYVDAGLPSNAFCYRVSAVLADGTEGEWSEEVCNDNCPFFLLPNVFSPNGDGANDRFSAEFGALPDGSAGCPRFVKSVEFQVHNRWGKPVFERMAADAGQGWVDWDGTDRHGRPMAPGVYYYVAIVEFDVTAKDLQRRTFRGWITLIR